MKVEWMNVEGNCILNIQLLSTTAHYPAENRLVKYIQSSF